MCLFTTLLELETGAEFTSSSTKYQSSMILETGAEFQWYKTAEQEVRGPILTFLVPFHNCCKWDSIPRCLDSLYIYIYPKDITEISCFKLFFQYYVDILLDANIW